jgi:ligand-binding sensor domain-containing protein
MKRVLTILIVLGSLYSCERSDQTREDSQGSPNTQFNSKVLGGYFVKSIAFDSKGNAWIGTFKQGLIKYNSHETKVFNSSNSIIKSDAVIWDIAVDSKDNVWIGCDGIMEYNGSNFILYNSGNTPIPEDFVYSIAIDSKDNVWFTSCRFHEGGFVRYDGTSWTVFTPDNSLLPVNLVQSIAIDENDNVWLALTEIVTQTYLIKISGSKWTAYTGNELGFEPYYFANIEFDSHNHLCGGIDYSLSSLGVNSGPQVFIFDGKGAEQLSFDNSTRIKSITIDNENNIWCATYGGYAVYNGVEWIVDNSAFRDAGVFTIEQGRDNKIWIGTGDGIYIND